MSLDANTTQTGRLHIAARRCAPLPRAVCRPRSAMSQEGTLLWHRWLLVAGCWLLVAGCWCE